MLALRGYLDGLRSRTDLSPDNAFQAYEEALLLRSRAIGERRNLRRNQGHQEQQESDGLPQTKGGGRVGGTVAPIFPKLIREERSTDDGHLGFVHELLGHDAEALAECGSDPDDELDAGLGIVVDGLLDVGTGHHPVLGGSMTDHGTDRAHGIEKIDFADPLALANGAGEDSRPRRGGWRGAGR